jgi:hypothetical protein
MARYKESVFGKISGKYGDAVAAVRKDGLCILKEYRIASNPNTEGQQKQRGKFGFTMKHLNCMRAVFTDIFANQYGINKAVSLAMKTCVLLDKEEYRMDYANLKLTSGSIVPPEYVEIVRNTTNQISLSWRTDEFHANTNDDYLNVVLVNFETKQLLYKKHLATRSAEHTTIQLPFSLEDGAHHVWVFYASAKGRTFSNALYWGVL